MTRLARNLYDLLFPEVEQFPHNVTWYRGFQEIGVSSLEEALQQGFLPLQPRASKHRPVILVHETSLPTLDHLIQQVAQLRDRESKQSIPPTSSGNTPPHDRLTEADQKYNNVQPTLPDIPPQDDMLTLPNRAHSGEGFPTDIEDHRKDIEEIEEEEDDEPSDIEYGDGNGDGNGKAQVEGEQQDTLAKGPTPSWLDAEHFPRYRDMLFAIWPSLDTNSIAQTVLGDVLDVARSEEIVRAWYEALHQVLADPKVLSMDVQALLPQAESLFRNQLQELKTTCALRQLETTQKAQVLQYFEEVFQPAWKQREEVWQAWLQEHLPSALAEVEREAALQSLQRLLTLFYGQAYRLSQDYWGKQPMEDVQMQWNGLIAECQQQVEGILRSREMRVAFRDQYKAHSDVSSLYPNARALRRQFVFFCGPTNSGKTYAAFEELAKSESGVYLAPLRLLALEGQHHLLSRGILTSFVTGEERDERKGAKFVSSTIEMAQVDKFVGGALIDEVQLLTHPQRGWAWIQALLGLPAHKLLLTGSEDALPLIQRIAEFLQEPLEVRYFTRFSELEVLPQVSSLQTLEPGTAIVCFSRRDVLGLKREIEEITSHRVAVIYGNLSPEVRRQEAQRFREGHAEILVATDAIGMGLNLPIRTVLFWTLEKNMDGLKQRLSPSEIKQIAGRAGRYGHMDRGWVGAFVETELQQIRQTLADELPPLREPCLVMPTEQHMTMIAGVLQSSKMIEVLRYFKREAWFSHELFAPAVTEAMEFLAEELADVLEPLSIEDQWTFVKAPISIRSRRLIEELRRLVEQFAAGRKLRLSPLFLRAFLQDHTEQDEQLREAEEHVQRLTLYQWLAYRFPKRFSDAENALVYRHILNRYIAQTLQHGRLRRRCRVCGTAIPMNAPSAICDPCYREMLRKPASASVMQ